MDDRAENRLTPETKRRLLENISRRQHAEGAEAIQTEFYRFEDFWEYQRLCLHREIAEKAGIRNPFFHIHDGVPADRSRIDGREMLNFSTYNYLGLCGDPRIAEAAKDAIDRYGTSAGASRVVSGEKPVHRELEEGIADMLEVSDAVVMVGGHATNVTTIGTLIGSRDLLVYDRLAHNSLLEGAKVSGAKPMAFKHNDWRDLDDVLTRCRGEFEKVLIVVEGLYSMDGDVAPLDRLIDVKRRHKALLMVDEAHSLGVLGKRGRGIREHFGIAGADVDIWMGTLSKTLASCGGYIAGSHALVELLKFTAPGFVYSVGMAPPAAAAANAALRIMLQEPWRVRRLNANAKLFMELAQERALDVGLSDGHNIVSIITGGSIIAGKLSNALANRRVNALPIIYPAVPERAARVRFFLSALHQEEQIRQTVDIVREEVTRLNEDIGN